MWDKIKKFAERLVSNDVQPTDVNDEEFRLSAAVLLVHAARIDGFYSEDEAKILKTQIQKYLQISEEEVSKLVKEADKAERESIDLYRFTSTLADHLDNDGRKDIIKLLWRIVLADNEVTPFEDNLVSRVAGLLGVSTEDRMLMRDQVKSEL